METVSYEDYILACNPDSIFKLQLEVIDEEDGSGTIHIEWDETDSELTWWTSMGAELQEKFILDSLHAAINNAPKKNVD
jgi:hypothetical protein